MNNYPPSIDPSVIIRASAAKRWDRRLVVRVVSIVPCSQTFSQSVITVDSLKGAH